MSAEVIVFLGPTLPVTEARALLDATYLPPARMGDVYDAVVRRRAGAIAIVDGLFDRVPSVWHKEILFALSREVRVFGSSSMGALRAAELHTFGMEGVGAVFEAFRDGRLEDDDEVTVTHGPAETDFTVTSEAMVNLRSGLERAAAAGVVTTATARALESAAKDRFYPDRSWEQVLFDGAKLKLPSEELAALAAFVRSVRPNVKRDDAIALLEHIARACARGLTPHAPTFDFEPTVFWHKLVATMSRAEHHHGAPSGITHDELRRQALICAAREPLLRGALLLHLLEREAQRLGVRVSKPMLARASDRFRRARGLVSARAMEAWMEQNHVSVAELSALLRLEALVGELCRYHGAAIDELVITELKRGGAYAASIADVAHQKRMLRELGVASATVEDTGIGLPGLIEWYQRNVRRIDGDLTVHAHDLRFKDAKEFLCQLAAMYLARTQQGAAHEGVSS
jgi:hypothetical protein